MEHNNNEGSAKEKYEAEKAAREARRREESMRDKRPRQMSRVAKTIGWVAGLMVIGILFWLWIQNTAPQTEDMSRAVPVIESPHIEVGAPHAEYNSNPPTSGPHYVQPAAPGFRGDEDIAEGHLVHSLEHGSVWVSYQSDVPESFVDIIREIAEGDSKVVATQRDANDTDIALAAWGRLDTFDLTDNVEMDATRIRDFITRHKNRGPERVDDTHRGI